jgi:ribonuclease P protein component
VANTSFQSHFRIRHKDEFRKIFAQSSSLRRRGVVLYFRKSGAGCNSRLGIIIARRACAKATMRNRMKREVRELFRREQSRFKGPHDILVRVMGSGRLSERGSARKVVRGLLEEAKVLGSKKKQ